MELWLCVCLCVCVCVCIHRPNREKSLVLSQSVRCVLNVSQSVSQSVRCVLNVSQSVSCVLNVSQSVSQASTLPQGTINLNVCVDVVDAESVTGQKHSLCICTPDREHYIRAENREVINGESVSE
ncbi:centrosome-associated protein CEP250 isoform X4 [Silurus meridionalis]|nr:centrosome-associated protein CEP250 isoform X4 [Silurus meridionalis]